MIWVVPVPLSRPNVQIGRLEGHLFFLFFAGKVGRSFNEACASAKYSSILGTAVHCMRTTASLDDGRPYVLEVRRGGPMRWLLWVTDGPPVQGPASNMDYGPELFPCLHTTAQSWIPRLQQWLAPPMAISLWIRCSDCPSSRKGVGPSRLGSKRGRRGG